MLLPDAGVCLGKYVHPGQLEAVAVFPFREPLPGKRVWLSRSRLAEHAGRILDEDEIESRLRSIGWMILHPQELPVRRQLEIMSDAETIGGFLGSAFHTLILANNIHARIRIIDRSMVWAAGTYEEIARHKRLDQQILRMPVAVLDPTLRRPKWQGWFEDPRDRERVVEMLNA